MRYLHYLIISLVTALVSAYTVLWFLHPAPVESYSVTIPPLRVIQEGDDLLVWGGWQTQAGYAAPGSNAVEIRCYRARGSCTEAYASIFKHDEGHDLEAAVFNYQVTTWTEQRLEAVASKAMAECLDRQLVIHLQDQAATLQWHPAPGCEGDTGKAVLVGDPL
jgi:hypothetical protein